MTTPEHCPSRKQTNNYPTDYARSGMDAQNAMANPT